MEQEDLTLKNFDLDEFFELKKPCYQVWLLGFDENDMATDYTYMLGEYPTAEGAISAAEDFFVNHTSEAILNLEVPNNTKYLEVNVETVVVYSNEDEDIEENIDTLYSKHFII